MSQKRVLIIEDEENIARVLKLELDYEGYEADTAHTGSEGLAKYREQSWDLVLLDVMLPEMSGTDILQRIRTKGDETPVIMLTARDAVSDKVAGLDLGANDYVTKPFQIEELLARIRAVLRLNGSSKDPVQNENEWKVQDLQVNANTREVIRAGKSIELTPREFDLLVYLMDHQGQVLTREQILDRVWGYDYFGDTNVVDVYVRYVRKKVDYPFEKALIQTVRGVGYVIRP
ncbi:response regulator transcription factor [Aureibacillus halotolerans]|uniref:DNA-binding response OmpR family regulator n=1 Tax=Aureibacillus halotolerans TaxID=1508390 RepID=A0A4R6TUL3_9BACI|nr:response regulator transcription factor [Aureibacillus halotolerans]TDQ37430.1 DNA-binding response OmpR family regulator [Aureibacillus halotolerans]